MKFIDLLGQQFHVVAGSQGHHGEVVGEAPHDVEGLPPNRAGAAEHCNAPWEGRMRSEVSLSLFWHELLRPHSFYPLQLLLAF
jgi:hypothetical protein